MFPVEYLVQLRDQFSAQAEKIAKTAIDAMKGAEGMGKALNAAEKAVASASTAMGSAAVGMQNIARNATQAQQGYAGIASAADKAAISQKKLAEIEEFRNKAAARLTQRDAAAAQRGWVRGPDGNWITPSAPKGEHATGRGGAMFGGMPSMHHIWQAWFGIELAKMGLHGINSAVSSVAEVDTVKQMMRQANVKSETIDNAVKQAWAMTQDNKNLSVGELMRMMNDMRMLVGSQERAIEDAPHFASMASYLKAYEAAREPHKRMTEGQFNREVYNTIKSAEIAAIPVEDYPRWIKNMMKMITASGGQVTPTQYLQAQRAAGVSYQAFSDEYKWTIFPQMVQEFGSGAGVMAMTTFNKVVANVMNRGYSLKIMEDAGLLIGAQHSKSGMPKVGTGEILKSDLMAADPLKWANDVFLPMIAKQFGFSPESIKTQAGVIALARATAKAFPDRKASMQLIELIRQTARLTRSSAGYQNVDEDFGKFQPYVKALQDVGAQFKNLLLAFAGDELAGKVTGVLQGLATGVGWVGTALKDHPWLRSGAQGGLVGLTGLLAFGLVGKATTLLLRYTGVLWGVRTAWTAVRAMGVGGATMGLLRMGAMFSGLSMIPGAGKLAMMAVGMSGLARATGLVAIALRTLTGMTIIGAGFLAYEYWDQIADVAERFGFKIGDITKEFKTLKSVVAGTFSGNFGDFFRWLGGKDMAQPKNVYAAGLMRNKAMREAAHSKDMLGWQRAGNITSRTDWGLIGKAVDWVKNAVTRHPGMGVTENQYADAMTAARIAQLVDRAPTFRESEISSMAAADRAGLIRVSLDAAPIRVEYVGPIQGPPSVPFRTSNHPRGTALAPDYGG